MEEGMIKDEIRFRYTFLMDYLNYELQRQNQSRNIFIALVGVFGVIFSLFFESFIKIIFKLLYLSGMNQYSYSTYMNDIDVFLAGTTRSSSIYAKYLYHRANTSDNYHNYRDNTHNFSYFII